jgi:uncharacterized damage-inducible protein DinB
MNEYLRTRYGDPCHICGYSWSTDLEACRRIIEDASTRFEALLSQRDGTERREDLEWNARAYVAHVADAMWIWAQRLAGAALDPSGSVVPYDETELGEVRGYAEIPLRAALWSLERATGDWEAADRLAEHGGAVLSHPEQGPLDVEEVRRILAHEVEHHALDVSSIVA